MKPRWCPNSTWVADRSLTGPGMKEELRRRSFQQQASGKSCDSGQQPFDPPQLDRLPVKLCPRAEQHPHAERPDEAKRAEQERDQGRRGQSQPLPDRRELR